MEYLIINNAKTGKRYKINYFKSYILDQSIQIPADFFSFSLTNQDGQISKAFTAGDEVFFYVKDTLVLNGIIDDFQASYGISFNDVEINGRDKTSLLLDNDAIPGTYYNLTIKEYLKERITQYGITKFEVDDNKKFDKIVVDPGDTEWSVIDRLCKERGLYPRYDVDVLKCTKLNSNTQPDYIFSNNISPAIRFKNISIRVSNDIKNEVITYGGHYSRGDYVNNSNIKGSYIDTTINTKKRMVINDNDLENNSNANDLAKSEIKNKNRNAFIIDLELHTAMPIFINKIARVVFDKFNLDCLMLVDNVQYSKSINEGTIVKVTLKLIEGVKVDWNNHTIPLIPK